jgi:tyrosyl-tRNA synthetase
VDANVTRLIYQLQKFFANANKYISKRNPSACAGTIGLEILNNAAWHSQFSLLDFLREVGTFAKLQPMLSKER